MNITHPKTTSAGVAAIAAAVLGAVAALLQHHSVDYASVIAAIVAGAGLLAAPDASKVIVKQSTLEQPK